MTIAIYGRDPSRCRTCGAGAYADTIQAQVDF